MKSSIRHLSIKGGSLNVSLWKWMVWGNVSGVWCAIVILTSLSKTWHWREDQRWRSLIHSGCASLSLCEITSNWYSIHIFPFFLCYFSSSHSGHEGRNPNVNMVAMHPSQALPSVECVYLNYFTLFVCMFSTQASFKVVFSANLEWWHGTNSYLALPSPSLGGE